MTIYLWILYFMWPTIWHIKEVSTFGLPSSVQYYFYLLFYQSLYLPHKDFDVLLLWSTLKLCPLQSEKYIELHYSQLTKHKKEQEWDPVETRIRVSSETSKQARSPFCCQLLYQCSQLSSFQEETTLLPRGQWVLWDP